MNHTAKAIKALRKTKGLTQQDLADMLKTTPQFICLIENGASRLPLPMAKKLIKKYNSTPIILALKQDALDEVCRGLSLK